MSQPSPSLPPTTPPTNPYPALSKALKESFYLQPSRHYFRHLAILSSLLAFLLLLQLVSLWIRWWISQSSRKIGRDTSGGGFWFFRLRAGESYEVFGSRDGGEVPRMKTNGSFIVPNGSLCWSVCSVLFLVL